MSISKIFVSKFKKKIYFVFITHMDTLAYLYTILYLWEYTSDILIYYGTLHCHKGNKELYIEMFIPSKIWTSFYYYKYLSPYYSGVKKLYLDWLPHREALYPMQYF